MGLYLSKTLCLNILFPYFGFSSRSAVNFASSLEIDDFIRLPSTINDVPKRAKSQLKELSIDKKIISATISTQNKNISNQVREHAKVKKMKVSASGADLKVEVKL